MKLRKKKLTILVLLGFVLICLVGYIFLNPILTEPKDTEYEDLSDLIEKLNNNEVLTTDEYKIISIQTGLSKTSIDKLIEKTEPKKLLDYQNDHLYNQEEVLSTFFFGSYQHELVKNHLQFVDIQDGDVLVTSTSHTFGFRHGHSGIVVDAGKGLTVESYTPFSDSKYDKLYTWLAFPEVMVLRLKEEYRYLINDIVEYTKNYLVGVKYSLLASTKQKITSTTKINKTQCSHLVWAAYYAFGIDLNSDGSWLVTANDISRSPYLEVVEVKGFHYLELW